MVNGSFWKGRRVLLTGHTGFKGMWASYWLAALGAEVSGLGLEPVSTPSAYALIGLPAGMSGRIGDMRDPAVVREAVQAARPSVVLHMAAQALVRQSYQDPAGTFATNIMGTVNLLDALRTAPEVSAVLIVTSDKVYENRDDGHAFAEDDRLGGADPYSASKAACELVTACYRESFFAPRGIALATARAGNVIGGGDWSADRLIPDMWRARREDRPVALRHPHATRPWQHVLEPVGGYLAYLERLAMDGGRGVPTALNFGPVGSPSLSVATVAERFAALSGTSRGWVQAEGVHPPEKALLAIDAHRAGAAIGWRPRLDAAETLEWTARWYDAFDADADMRAFTADQISAYRDRLS